MLEWFIYRSCETFHASRICPSVLGHDSVLPTVNIATVKPAAVLNLEDTVLLFLNYMYIYVCIDRYRLSLLYFFKIYIKEASQRKVWSKLKYYYRSGFMLTFYLNKKG